MGSLKNKQLILPVTDWELQANYDYYMYILPAYKRGDTTVDIPPPIISTHWGIKK